MGLEVGPNEGEEIDTIGGDVGKIEGDFVGKIEGNFDGDNEETITFGVTVGS